MVPSAQSQLNLRLIRSRGVGSCKAVSESWVARMAGVWAWVRKGAKVFRPAFAWGASWFLFGFCLSYSIQLKPFWTLGMSFFGFSSPTQGLRARASDWAISKISSCIISSSLSFSKFAPAALNRWRFWVILAFSAFACSCKYFWYLCYRC